MKYSAFYLSVLAVALPFLGGCGKQGQSGRADLSSSGQGFESKQTREGVTVSVKQLTSKDRGRLFGKNNLPFSPMLMTVENNGTQDICFEADKQALSLLDPATCNIGKLKAAKVGRILVPAAGIGAGAVSVGAGIFATFVGWFQGVPLVMWAGVCSGVVGALALPAIGILCGKKIARSRKAAAQQLQQACIHNGSKLTIKAGMRESMIMLFEKDSIPEIVSVTLQAQTGFFKSLNFELDTNRSLKAKQI